MNHTRRSILKKASALSALAVGASVTASAADCSGVSEWDADTAYNGGDQATYDGELFTAEWWTQGEEPDDSKSVWTLEGSCDGDDGDDGGDETDCTGVPEWDANTAYTSGDQAVYEGTLWEANWWSQGDEPGASQWGAWEELGNCVPMPVADFSVSSTRVEPGESVSMDMTSSENWDSYEWTTNGQTMDWGATPTYTFEEEGSYDVGLTVSDADGNADSTSRTISVGTSPPPTQDGVYTPYQGTWHDLVDGTLNKSTDRVIVSFVGDATRDGEINPGWLSGCNSGSCNEDPLSAQTDAIQTLQDNGIDVGISIGGWHSPVVARDAENAEELKDAYANILDTFGIDHIDIDDENADQRNEPVYELRNEALAMLQDERPEVTIGFTVSSTQDGIVATGHSHGRTWVADAHEKGLELDYIQPMTMNFVSGFSDITPALEGTVDFLESEVYTDRTRDEIWSMMGVTPNLNEISTQDAQDLLDYAEEKGMYSIAPWVLGNDTNGEFSDVFYEFESGN